MVGQEGGTLSASEEPPPSIRHRISCLFLFFVLFRVCSLPRHCPHAARPDIRMFISTAGHIHSLPLPPVTSMVYPYPKLHPRSIPAPCHIHGLSLPLVTSNIHPCPQSHPVFIPAPCRIHGLSLSPVTSLVYPYPQSRPWFVLITAMVHTYIHDLSLPQSHPVFIPAPSHIQCLSLPLVTSMVYPYPQLYPWSILTPSHIHGLSPLQDTSMVHPYPSRIHGL